MLYQDPKNLWKPSDHFLFNQTAVDIDFVPRHLSEFIGNITLVTNVASF